MAKKKHLTITLKFGFNSDVSGFEESIIKRLMHGIREFERNAGLVPVDIERLSPTNIEIIETDGGYPDYEDHVFKFYD
jgi:hypothetical protein